MDLKPVILKRILDVLALMLAPMAPHIAEELWEMLGNQGGMRSRNGRAIARI